jgi:hypothetical protein
MIIQKIKLFLYENEISFLILKKKMERICKEDYNFYGRVWKNSNGQRSRNHDLPADIFYTKTFAPPDFNCSMYWYKIGKYHRKYDRPAIFGFLGSREWITNGINIRADKFPIFIDSSGEKIFYEFENRI